jgi:hypothetical protein
VAAPLVAHPFERLSDRVLRAACLALLLVWVLLTGVLVAAVPLDHARELLDFLSAGTATDAAARAGAWSGDVRASARFVLYFDFLYDVVHDNAVALLCAWAARRLASRAAVMLARVVAWTLWLDIAFNVVENLAALHIVGGGSAAPWFDLVVALTTFRFVTLWLGFALGVVGLALGRWRHRGTLG